MPLSLPKDQTRPLDANNRSSKSVQCALGDRCSSSCACVTRRPRMASVSRKWGYMKLSCLREVQPQLQSRAPQSKTKRAESCAIQNPALGCLANLTVQLYGVSSITQLALSFFML